MDFALYLEDYEREFLICEEADVSYHRAELMLKTHDKLSEIERREAVIKYFTEDGDLFTEAASTEVITKKKNLIKQVWNKFITWLKTIGDRIKSLIVTSKVASDATYKVHKEILKIKQYTAKFVDSVKNFLKSPTGKAISAVIVAAGAFLVMKKLIANKKARLVDLNTRKQAHQEYINRNEEKAGNLRADIHKWNEAMSAASANTRDTIEIKNTELINLRDQLAAQQTALENAISKGADSEVNFYSNAIAGIQSAMEKTAVEHGNAKKTLEAVQLPFKAKIGATEAALKDVNSNIDWLKSGLSAIDKDVLREFGSNIGDNPNMFAILRAMVHHVVGIIVDTIKIIGQGILAGAAEAAKEAAKPKSKQSISIQINRK